MPWLLVAAEEKLVQGSQYNYLANDQKHVAEMQAIANCIN